MVTRPDVPVLRPETATLLRTTSVDSIFSVLAQFGYPDQFLTGLPPLRPDRPTVVGTAVTLRCVMLRPDVVEEVKRRYPRGLNQELAGSVLPGDIVVVDACGSLEAGLTGDVTVAGLIQRGGVGMVVDGALRDKGALLSMDIAIYCRGWHASGYSRRILPYEPFVAIQCAGVTVVSGDVIVGDAEGVIALPSHLADDVAQETRKLDAKERIQRQMVDVERRPLTTVYPPDEATQAEINRRLAE